MIGMCARHILASLTFVSLTFKLNVDFIRVA